MTNDTSVTTLSATAPMSADLIIACARFESLNLRLDAFRDMREKGQLWASDEAQERLCRTELNLVCTLIPYLAVKSMKEAGL